MSVMDNLIVFGPLFALLFLMLGVALVAEVLKTPE